MTARSRVDSSASASATVYVTDFAGNLSWRNDAGLTGQNLRELALSPATLKELGFLKIKPIVSEPHAFPQRNGLGQFVVPANESNKAA